MTERRFAGERALVTGAGLVGLRGRAAYCASKGALIALTRALTAFVIDGGLTAA
jgi:NAD(P)-dependent dehydrogenase (short-subunit alcohol dehydrogenase family)